MDALPAAIVVGCLWCVLSAASCVPLESNGAGVSADDVEIGETESESGQAEAPLSRAYCEAQRDAILALCRSPATPPNLKAACVAAAWIGFVGCLRLPGDA